MAPLTERQAVTEVESEIVVIGIRSDMVRVHALSRALAASLACVVIAALYPACPQLDIRVVALSFLACAALPVVILWSGKRRMFGECCRQFGAMLARLGNTYLSLGNLRTVVRRELAATAVVSVAVVKRLALVPAEMLARFACNRRASAAATLAHAGRVRGWRGRRSAVVTEAVARLVKAIPSMCIKRFAAATCAEHRAFYHAAA